MFPIPLWVAKVNKSKNWNKKIKRKLENLEVWPTHGCVWDTEKVRGTPEVLV